MNKTQSVAGKTAAALVFVLILTTGLYAQKKKPVKPAPKTAVAAAPLPKVTQIDGAGLKTALKPNGRPLVANFWATWCDPCREEFPDLVLLDADYKGRVDVVTVSLDDLAEINRDVPKFLGEMKASMPAYLLKVEDENAVINSITADWQGGLPFTILYNEQGEIAYFKQGKFKPLELRAEIDKLMPKTASHDLPTNESPKRDF
jgi:thiol-disulfide isomerase/thioredoxin